MNTIDPPEELFHYTTQDGLLGILKDDSLWVSSVIHLNDSSEYLLALELAKQELNDRKNKTDGEEEKIDCLLNNIKTIQNSSVMVASFTKKRDCLSQWNFYGKFNGGYSIGFNTNHLIQEANKQGYAIDKCFYEPNEQKQIIAKLINESLMEDFNIISEYVPENKPRTIVILATGGDFWKRLLYLAPIIKNKAFNEEEEWRLISCMIKSSSGLCFRTGKSFLIPYYKFSLGPKKSYLSSITIGPTPNPDLARLSIERLLTKYEVKQNVKIFNTEIPFRNW